MAKLIVDTEQGTQELIVVGEGGRYWDPDRVVWDERVDGLLTADQLLSVGGLVKKGQSLDVDSAKLSAQKAAKAAAAANAEQKRQKVQTARDAIEAADISGALSKAQADDLLKALVTLARGK